MFYAIWPFPSFCSDDLESKPKEAKAAKAAKKELNTLLNNLEKLENEISSYLSRATKRRVKKTSESRAIDEFRERAISFHVSFLLSAGQSARVWMRLAVKHKKRE